jgi:flagellar hook-associated protein 1 FlgK
MAGSLFQIARSGAAAARASIELTAQNIANATNPDYARRSLEIRELVGLSSTGNGVLNGVQLLGISRNDSVIVQRQARHSAGELARADAELSGLRDAELALEQSRLFEGLVEFEAVLTQLEGNPLEPALRTNTLETARQLANTFRSADSTLTTAREQVQEAATVSLDQVNRQAAELARINRTLVDARAGTAGQAALFDARDATLRALAQEVGIAVEFDARGAATVRLAGASAPPLVDGLAGNAITAAIAADGTLSFALAGSAFAPASGTLAGQAAALEAGADFQARLNSIAADTIARANEAQARGADQTGAPGQPLFTGTGAADMALALTSGTQLATAPAGSSAGSTNTGNLAALTDSIGANEGPIRELDRLLLGLSSRIAAQDTTRSGLAVIADNAQAALLSETGVDLDTEAANLVRLQQAFEANGRVLQVAADIFDTILGLR